MLKTLGFIVLIAMATLLAIALIPLPATQLSTELTRYLWSSQASNSRDTPLLQGEQSFFGVQGPATIRLSRTCNEPRPLVVLNNEALDTGWQPKRTSAPDQTIFERDVSLQAENQIVVVSSAEGDTEACSTLRVTQGVMLETHALSRVHFNTNVSNFSASRAFYGELGFTTLSTFPDTNTQAMAQAIGISTPTDYDGAQGDHAGGYLLHGELIGLGGFGGGVIDLIEFTIPRNEEPPYDSVNRLGMSHAVMYTADLDGAASALINLNAQPGPIATNKRGHRFLLFTDPDGTRYELREEPNDSNIPVAEVVSALGAVNINVSDIERSRSWYQLLGYTLNDPIPVKNDRDIAEAYGFSGQIERRSVELRQRNDNSALELTQWATPYDSRPPYPVPVNHLGIHRMAFSTSDIAADVRMLKAQGVRFVSEPTPCCSGPDSSGSIVAFYDPDGTIVELVEQPFLTPLLTLSLRLGRWFG